MTQLEMPEVRTLDMKDIKPYWRNPRRMSDEAVEGLKTSLREYGYQQPLVVDTANVLVVGHTRYAAMLSMGIERVDVYVSQLDDDKNREYRLVDNKTGEMSDWDHSALVVELREFETALLDQFFPDIDLEITSLDDAMVTDEDIEKAVKEVTSVKEAAEILTTRVECPACFHSFQVRTDSLPGLSQADMEEMSERGGTQ